MNTIYEITLEASLPVLTRVRISAQNEWEAAALAQRIAGSANEEVKGALEIEPYPVSQWLTIHGVAEITPLQSEDADRRVWTTEQLSILLDQNSLDSRLAG